MKRKYEGRELAKILVYYGLIDSVSALSFNISCPFHEDNSPSMLINLENGSFYCFVCDISGNAFDFVQYLFPDYTEIECCMQIEKILCSEKVSGVSLKNRKRKKKYSKQAIIEAKDYYYGLLTNDWYSLSTDEEKTVFKYMSARGFLAKDLQYADAKVNCDIAYPVIFPIYDNGEFRGWVARTTNKRVEKIRKYLYNEGFRKRESLCGTYGEKSVPVICEGYLDWLSLSSRGGFKNVVALLGWHLSDGQYEKLRAKNITKVISFLDNDECGEKGTRYLERFFDVVRFPFPKNVKDAGDMNKKQLWKARRELMAVGIKM